MKLKQPLCKNCILKRICKYASDDVVNCNHQEYYGKYIYKLIKLNEKHKFII